MKTIDLNKVNVDLMKHHCVRLGVQIDIKTLSAEQTATVLLAKALRWHYTGLGAGYECDVCGGYSTADTPECPYCGADGIEGAASAV